MTVAFDIQGLDKLKAELAGFKERIGNTREGLIVAGNAALEATADRIRDGGYGAWAPTLSGNPLLRRSGALLDSLTPGSANNIERVEGNSVEVGTSVPYARYVQEGTGVFGPRGQPISPKNGKVLAFQMNGTTIFARNVKGSQARPFLILDDKANQKITEAYHSYIDGGLNVG